MRALAADSHTNTLLLPVQNEKTAHAVTSYSFRSTVVIHSHAPEQASVCQQVDVSLHAYNSISCTGTHLSCFEFDTAYKNNTLGFPELFFPSSLLLLQKSRREHKLHSDVDGREKNKVIFLALISVTPHYHVSRRRRKPRARME